MLENFFKIFIISEMTGTLHFYHHNGLGRSYYRITKGYIPKYQNNDRTTHPIFDLFIYPRSRLWVVKSSSKTIQCHAPTYL